MRFKLNNLAMAVDQTGVTQRSAVNLANTVLVDVALQDIIFWGTHQAVN